MAAACYVLRSASDAASCSTSDCAQCYVGWGVAAEPACTYEGVEQRVTCAMVPSSHPARTLAALSQDSPGQQSLADSPSMLCR